MHTFSVTSLVASLFLTTKRFGRHLKRKQEKDLENRSLEFLIVKEFHANLKQEFGNEDNKLVKVAELKKIE